MKKTLYIAVWIAVLGALASGKMVLDRSWTFTSSSDVTCAIADTLTVRQCFFQVQCTCFR